MVLVTVQPSLPMESCTHGARETMDDWDMGILSAHLNQNRYGGEKEKGEGEREGGGGGVGGGREGV